MKVEKKNEIYITLDLPTVENRAHFRVSVKIHNIPKFISFDRGTAYTGDRTIFSGDVSDTYSSYAIFRITFDWSSTNMRNLSGFTVPYHGRTDLDYSACFLMTFNYPGFADDISKLSLQRQVNAAIIGDLNCNSFKF